MKAKTKTQAQAIATAATAATQQMHQNEPWLSMNGEYGRTRATTRNPFGLSLSRMAFSSVHGNSHLQQNPWRRKGVRRKRKKKFEKAKRIESRLDRTSKMMPLQKKTTSPPPPPFSLSTVTQSPVKNVEACDDIKAVWCLYPRFFVVTGPPRVLAQPQLHHRVCLCHVHCTAQRHRHDATQHTKVTTRHNA